MTDLLTLCHAPERPAPSVPNPEAQLALPFPQACTVLLAYIAQLACATLAERSGLNPDAHPALHKVTQTH
jgi:hypothetical protein